MSSIQDFESYLSGQLRMFISEIGATQAVDLHEKNTRTEARKDFINTITTEVEELLKKFTIESYSKGYADMGGIIKEIIILKETLAPDFKELAKGEAENTFMALKRIL